jgi:hypothetical protein
MILLNFDSVSASRCRPPFIVVNQSGARSLAGFQVD